jgi:hypothetical protein
MSKAFTLNHLTEGIKDRNNSQEGARLVEKWSRTGLLRGLDGTKRDNMARLMENQAAQVLREVNSIGAGGGSTSSSGDIRGFANIAFPIVRRVFGGLVANELVSIQPMSLPSGLLFYLDYTYGTNVGGDTNLQTGASTVAQTYTAGQSIYNNPVGKGIRSGSLAVGGQYDLVGTSYSQVHQKNANVQLWASGAFHTAAGANSSTIVNNVAIFATGTDGKLIGFDPQIANLIESNSGAGGPGATAGNGVFTFAILKTTGFTNLDSTQIKDVSLYTLGVTPTIPNMGLGTIGDTVQGGANLLNVRRLNQLGTFSGGVFTPNPLVSISDANAAILTVVSGVFTPAASGPTGPFLTASYVISDAFSADPNDASALTVPVFESDFGLGNGPQPIIPEIDIKIESIAVTATTRKLRARWSPELAQDLNAYHSMDAEVELTQILSEQIALEIDREILNDLLTQANGANYYWSRAPGRFVNKVTGAEVLQGTNAPGPQFTGTVREWYETLIETIIDVANEIHRKTLRGSANFIVVSPDVATVLEASVLYKPSYSLDGQGQVGSGFSIGATPIGSLSNRFTVYKDPYFPRNKILVGYKGGSYLETGYVYAPYVPLIVTPTIFAPEDFTPRKGVMTRYGKKMVRSDFYGTVTCLDMNII